MANLLPQERRIKIERERWARMWTVLAIMFLATLLLCCVSLAPSYLLSRSKGEDAERQIALVQKFIAIQEENGVAEAVRHTRVEMDFLAKKTRENRFGDILRMVQGKAPEGVILEHILIDASGEKREFTISGNAVTRNNLLTYQDLLENEPMFTDVELPVSNLAKSADIDFLLKITLGDQP